MQTDKDVDATQVGLEGHSRFGKNTNRSYGGGLVGAMLSAALASQDDISTCSAGELPDAVRAVLDPQGQAS